MSRFRRLTTLQPDLEFSRARLLYQVVLLEHLCHLHLSMHFRSLGQSLRKKQNTSKKTL
jgi:hypothetical protein